MPKKSKTNVSSAYVWGLTRISLGIIFLWAFLDKLIGLGFTTCRSAVDNTEVVTLLCDNAWLSGGSPTTGFLQFATSGPFASFFQSLAGNVLVDWLFMIGLAGIGIGLTFGIAMKLAVWSGVAMMILMWLAALPPEHNPLIDDHIVYALVLIGLLLEKERKFSLNKQWQQTTIAKNIKILR